MHKVTLELGVDNSRTSVKVEFLTRDMDTLDNDIKLFYKIYQLRKKKIDEFNARLVVELERKIDARREKKEETSQSSDASSSI